MNKGYIQPSWMHSESSIDFSQAINQNFALKVGQVIQIIYPDEKRKSLNTQSTFYPVLYTVMVEDKNQHNRNQNIYYNCMLADSFGGTADYLEYTHRSNPVGEGQGTDLLDPSTKVDPTKLLGSYVLILCVNGTSAQPIIISGLKSYQAPLNTSYVEAKKEDGHYLKFSFNGVDFQINKLGEVEIIYNGPNDNAGKLLSETPDGTAVDAKSVGSFIKINKSGDIMIAANSTKDKDKPDNYLNLKKDGTITITNGDKQVITMDKNGDNITIFGQNVQLGNKNALDFVALSSKVDQAFSTLYNQLLSHMHPTTAPGAPTGPPMPPGFSPPASVAGKHVKGS